MKKILALILSVSLLFGCIMTTSAWAAEVQLTDTDEALALLTYMGIAKKSDNLVSNITRAEFATAAAKAIKAQSSSGKQYYIDVEANSDAFESVSALIELGYLSGGDNMSFRPNDNIRLAEAAKIVTSLIGYSVLCEAKGGYPAGYLEVVSRLGITKGITGEYITREQAYVMFMRAVNTPLYVPSAISQDGTSYEVDEDATILSQYHDLYYIEDTVNAVGQISLKSAVSLNEDKVLIGDKTLRTDELSQDMYDYLGMTIVGYYTKTESRDASLVVALPLGDDNNVIVVSKDELSSIEDEGGYYTFTYYNENGKYKTIKVPKGCVVLKNGMSVTSNLFKELTISKGSYKFLDHDGDDKIDVLFVNEYYNLVVELIENKEGMIYLEEEYGTKFHRGPVGSGGAVYDKFAPSRKIDLSEEDGKIVKIKDSYGNIISAANIFANDVLTVYKSKDGKYLEVIKGMGSIDGIVSKISYIDNNTAEVTIGEDTYTISNDVIAQNDDALNVGLEGTFRLDAFGEIAYYELTSSDIIYGYLVDVDEQKKAFTDVRLRLFGMDGILGIFTWEKNKTVVDGKKLSNAEEAKEYFASCKKQIVRFSANDNNVLTFMDTLNKTKEESINSIRQNLPFGKRSLNDYTGLLADTSMTISSTPVMVVPPDEIIDSRNYDETDFKVSRRSAIFPYSTTVSGMSATYFTDDDGVMDEIIVYKGGEKTPTNNPALMIDSIVNGVDSDGDEISIVRGYNAKRPTTFKTSDANVLDGYNLKKGDLVWFELDKNDRICSVIDILVHSDDPENPTIANSAGVDTQRYYAKDNKLMDQSNDAPFAYMYGYAGIMKDGVIRFAYTKDSCENESYDFSRVITSTPVIVYDKDYGINGGIYWSTWNDIIDYRNDEENCSIVVMKMKRKNPQIIFVYK